jgi:hypothetical protein
MTTVTNLATGKEQVFSLPPRQAVVNAWYQSKNNWNTWQYNYEAAPVIEGDKTVACGDFCAFKEAAHD